MGCNCKKTKTPTPPTNRVVVKETQQINDIVDKLKKLIN